jgi:ornithine cyclodeaminase
MEIVDLDTIKAAVAGVDLLPIIEAGFVAYSRGRATVPPVGELILHDPPGEVHIKYGYLRGGDHYVIKVASGFSDNPQRGLPSGDGLMLLFSQQTGQPELLLLDRGYLTDLRTAVAGAICARHLAPALVTRIGIVGTGVQARLQLRHLAGVTTCRNVLAWGRSPDKLAAYQSEMTAAGFHVKTARSPAELTATCNLIVTATAARAPLLFADQVRPGTHITAVGSDTPDKQELDPGILARADRVVADSISQCKIRGEIAHALRAGAVQESALVELGNVISGDAPGRTEPYQITVADLTGVAVQDIQIAEAVYHALQPNSQPNHPH